jgi:hypothetical protein
MNKEKKELRKGEKKRAGVCSVLNLVGLPVTTFTKKVWQK